MKFEERYVGVFICIATLRGESSLHDVIMIAQYLYLHYENINTYNTVPYELNMNQSIHLGLEWGLFEFSLQWYKDGRPYLSSNKTLKLQGENGTYVACFETSE